MVNLQEHYTGMWRKEHEDSTAHSRNQLANQVIAWMQNDAEDGGNILSVGSGPHTIEKILRNKMLEPKSGLRDRLGLFHFETMDIASISRMKLVRHQNHPLNYQHVQANALHMPYARDQFNLVYSNLAIDLAGREVFQEAARVLTPGGKFVFNFHHPNLWAEHDLDREGLTDTTLIYWKYLRDKRILFSSEDEIQQTFSGLGLSIDGLSLEEFEEDGYLEKHWHVTGHKLLPE